MKCVCTVSIYPAVDLTVDKGLLGETLRRITWTAMTVQDLEIIKLGSCLQARGVQILRERETELFHSHRRQHGKRLEMHHEELNIEIKTSRHWIEHSPGSRVGTDLFPEVSGMYR